MISPKELGTQEAGNLPSPDVALGFNWEAVRSRRRMMFSMGCLRKKDDSVDMD